MPGWIPRGVQDGVLLKVWLDGGEHGSGNGAAPCIPTVAEKMGADATGLRLDEDDIKPQFVWTLEP